MKDITPFDEAPMQIKAVYDNGGETCDRYTVVFNVLERETPVNFYMMLGMSDAPTHPQGFSQFCSGQMGKHLGKRIKFSELPKHIQKHIKYRMVQP